MDMGRGNSSHTQTPKRNEGIKNDTQSPDDYATNGEYAPTEEDKWGGNRTLWAGRRTRLWRKWIQTGTHFTPTPRQKSTNRKNPIGTWAKLPGVEDKKSWVDVVRAPQKGKKKGKREHRNGIERNNRPQLRYTGGCTFQCFHRPYSAPNGKDMQCRGAGRKEILIPTV